MVDSSQIRARMGRWGIPLVVGGWGGAGMRAERVGVGGEALVGEDNPNTVAPVGWPLIWVVVDLGWMGEERIKKGKCVFSLFFPT